MTAILANIQKSVNVQGIDTYKEMSRTREKKKRKEEKEI